MTYKPLSERTVSELKESFRITNLLSSNASDDASFRIYQERADAIYDEIARRKSKRQRLTRLGEGSQEKLDDG